MIEVGRPKIAVVERRNLWRVRFDTALREQGFETSLVDPGNDPLEAEAVRGRMHIVHVNNLSSLNLEAVRRISQLGGQSLVVPSREQAEAISTACLNLKGAYTVPDNMIGHPEIVGRAALLMMWGKG